jgi:starvation-inducible DNA-binding protein
LPPEHNYSKYAQVAGIVESTKLVDGIISVEQILKAFKIVILMQREILVLAADANDEGTNALMSDNSRLQEKQVWMYSAFLKK